MSVARPISASSREVRRVRSRRRARTELWLILFAVVLAVGCYVMVAFGKTGKAPAHVGVYVAILAAAFLGAHVVTVRLAPGADPALLPTAALLAGLGYAIVYRTNPGYATNQFGWILVSVVLYCLTLFVVRDHRRLDAYTYTIGLVGIVMLLLPILPSAGRIGGFALNDARLWFRVGPLTFQPAEVGKVLIVIFLASYLNGKKELLSIGTRRIGPLRLPEPRYLAPLLVAWGVSMVVLFTESDLGSSLLFFGIFVVMLWLATGRATYLAIGAALFAAGAYAAYLLVPRVAVRVTIWLHALDPRYIHDQSYQLSQSLFAFATGGISGTGLGLGHPNLIPNAWTDFILSSIGEELGLIGVTAVLLLYVILVGRGLKAAIDSEDGFSSLLAAGLATVIGLQTFVIVGGVTRVIPLTGVTLPFVSYGGSSLVTNFILVALLVRISGVAAVGPPTRRRGIPTGADGDEPVPPSPVDGARA